MGNTRIFSLAGVTCLLAFPSPTLAADKLAWGSKVSKAFRTKVRAISKRLKLQPDHLMAIMAFETNKTFSPKQTTTTSSAIGLIQFMPNTAKTLGTTAAKLKAMSAVDQLTYVEKYFKWVEKTFKVKLKSLTDAYLAVLLPGAIKHRKPSHAVFDQKTKRRKRQYDANKWLDKNRDKKVTRAEITAYITKFLKAGQKPKNRA